MKQENPDSLLLKEIDDCKRLVAEFTLANEAFKKNTTPEERREVVRNLVKSMSMRQAGEKH